MIASSPVAFWRGFADLVCVNKVAGTEMGTASSGTGAGLWQRQLSIAQAISVVYVVGVAWKGDGYEANSMVLAMAPTAWLTDPTLTFLLRPKAPDRTFAAKPVVMRLLRTLETSWRKGLMLRDSQ